ncbi:hypothetical protein [Haliscomenobacter sp.]|uniref:hypothetical protein n=1 Tax=Haliscomenobacter sp. TaxID=2717303 RepID=UPI0035933E2C
MQHHSANSSYNLRSEARPELILFACFLSLFPAAGLAVQFIDIPKDEAPGIKLIGLVFVAVSILFFLVIWRGYHRIRIRNGNVSIRGFSRSYIFSIDQIRAYTTTLSYDDKNNQFEYLYLGLKDGQVIVLYLPHYHNWAIIKGTFTRGVHRDEALLELGDKHFKWLEIVSTGVVTLVAIGIWFLTAQSPDYQEDPFKFNVMFGCSAMVLIAFAAWKYWEYTQMPPK